MDQFDELKAVWHTSNTKVLPSSEATISEIKRFRSSRLRKKWIVISCAFLMTVLMIILLSLAKFTMLSTYIGGAIIASAGVFLAYTNIRSLRRFNELSDYSNLDFLSFIEKTRQNQIYYYKKTQLRIILICITGLLIYLYESFLKNPVATIVLYALSILFYLLLWFWLRPRQFKKDSAKLDAIINRLDNISKQLK